MLEGLWREDFTLHHINAMRQGWRSGDEYTFRRTPRAEHGLMYLSGCDVRYETRQGEKLSLSRGTLVYLGKRAGYVVRFENVVSQPSCLLVNFQLDDARGRDMDLSLEVLPLSVGGAEAESAMRRLVDLYYSPEYAPAEMKGRLYELLCLVSRRLSGREDAPAELMPALEWLGSHGHASIRELAARCGLSESAFRRRFRDYAGMSPSDYRCEQQIEQAVRLLESSTARVGEIASSLGFEDVNYFCRLFKKRTGKTPLEYKKQSDLC